jgi:biopolymer transport protein ExbD
MGLAMMLSLVMMLVLRTVLMMTATMGARPQLAVKLPQHKTMMTVVAEGMMTTVAVMVCYYTMQYSRMIF